ncbi:helix-turn-helix transcriptional regulator [Celerinatantimonas sp. MCCC 1A17872]|uniref:helix-turn-helix transcriptional regulator n=1 Tax=Celerinatantimonas sp. MCCC 1A17872 TaxID=3177514 RepID=UPI0038BE4A02
MLKAQNLLGQFIRAHREQLSPPETRTTRRRTPGYRREELAEEAGLSTNWLTRLEQGRSQTASVSVLARLAQVLKLNAAERATLFELAGKYDPYPDMQSAQSKNISEPILKLPEQFNGPCYLLDSYWNALSWNTQATELFIGWLDESQSERNLLRYTFLNPAAQTLIPNWSERAQRLVAEFRPEYAHHSETEKMAEFVQQLQEQSELFKALWQTQQARYRDGGIRYFIHPTLGHCQFQQINLQVSAASDLKLVCLTPIN